MAASSERKVHVGLLLALVASAALIFFPCAPSSERSGEGPLTVERGRTDRQEQFSDHLSAPPPTPKQFGGAAPPVIDSITLEKNEVCEGEENLVQVRAHTTDGSDAFLHYVVGGDRGPSVPVRTYLLPDGKPLHQTATVFSRDGASTTADIPTYHVKECRSAPIVVLACKARANVIDQLDFEAKIIEPATSIHPFRPVHYAWDFGDGAATSTAQSFVSHSYARRTQTGMYSNYLVTVRVFAESGDDAVGRSSIELLNLAYQDMEKFGIVSIVGQGTPRFPSLSPDGVVRQRFEIWQYYSEAVKIERIRLLLLDDEGKRYDEAEGDLSILSSAEIAAGESISAELSFDTSRYPRVLALVYRLEGHTVDGRRAFGEITVMKPPPKPTRENSVLVSSPEKVQRIRMALEILGRDTVSQEDLWQLEREGKLPPEVERRGRTK